MFKLCDLDPAAKEKLPPATPDKSGIGVHYVDAVLKDMKGRLDNGIRVSAKRRGLRIDLKVGKRKGSGLMRRLEVSKDPVVMLRAALQEAAEEAHAQIEITATEIQLLPANEE